MIPNQNLNLNAYDIARRACSEIATIASNCGIDWQATEHRLLNSHGDSSSFDCIPFNKNDKGKVKAWFHIKTAKNGQQYPTISFNTMKHGGYSETFNGYQWLIDNEYVKKPNDYVPKPKKETPKPKLSNKEINQYEHKLNRFNRLKNEFEQLLPLNNENIKGSYLEQKGFEFNDAMSFIKRGNGFIIFTVKNITGDLTGFQKIYDAKQKHLNNSNKEYCFYPLKDGTTLKKGSYAIIGNVNNVNDIIYLTEGFATGLSVHLASGAPVIIALDATNLMPVAKQVIKRYEKVIISADNDINENGNTGIYCAIKTAKELKLKVVYPTHEDGLKCDFDDIRQTHGLDIVKTQLNTNKLTIQKNQLDYYKQLIEVAPKNQLNKIIKTACYFEGKNSFNVDLVNEHSSIIQELVNQRKIEFDVKKEVLKFFKRNRFEIIKYNSLFDFDGITEIDITDYAKDNQRIEKIINDILKENNGQAIFIDTRPMGQGKTELMKLISDNSENTVYVCHRIALTKNAANRIGLTYYETAKDNYDSLAVCANSIVKHNISNQCNVLFIDEARQTLEHILNGTCENRFEVYDELVSAIQNANLVILSDADFNQSTLDWLKTIANKPIHALTTEIKSNDKTIHRLNNNIDILKHAKQDLLDGKNIWLFSDSLKQVNKSEIFFTDTNLKEFLNELGLSEDDYIVITQENKGDAKQAAFLANPEMESKKYRLVIHSPVISSGVSITHNHFSVVYAVFCNVIPPNEMLQSIARVRTVKNIYCSFAVKHNNLPTNEIELINGLENTRKCILPNGNIEIELTDFDKLRLKSIANRNKSINDFEYYFLNLANIKGYNINDCKNNQKKDSLLNTELSGRAKGKRNQSILNAGFITDSEAKTLGLKNNLTQAETDSLKKYEIIKMTGKAFYEPIEESDINFYCDDKGLSKLNNYELLTADKNELIAFDCENLKTHDKLTSKTFKQLIFTTVINGLTGKKVNNTGAAGVCEFLHEHYEALAINELGNYKKLSRYAVRQLNGFLERIGFELVELEQDAKGVRWYKLELNPLIKEYANRRMEKKAVMA